MAYTYILITITFILTSCIQTPDLSSTKEESTQLMIKKNKHDATKAKEAYAQLQKKRSSEE